MPIPTTPEQRLNPHPIYKHMRETAPIQFDEAARAWLVLDYENVRKVFFDHATFSSNFGFERTFARLIDGFPPFLIGMDQPRHGQLRQLVSRSFTPTVIARLEPAIRDIVNDLLDRVIESGTMKLNADFAVPLPLAIIAEMLGMPAEDQPRLKFWSDQVIVSSQSEAAGHASGGYEQPLRDLCAYLIALIEERTKRPRQDLIGDLVTAEVDGSRLSILELVAYVIQLLVAGTDTITTTIGNAFRVLLAHPEDLARLRAEPALLPVAIEEIWRFEGPLTMIPRISTRDVELGDRRVAAGQLVFVMVASANRDEKVFADPDRFDITRTPNPHIALGYGIHFCLGATLARLVVRTALEAMLERLTGLERAGDEPLAPHDAPLMNGIKELELRFHPGEPLGQRGTVPAT